MLLMCHSVTLSPAPLHCTPPPATSSISSAPTWGSRGQGLSLHGGRWLSWWRWGRQVDSNHLHCLHSHWSWSVIYVFGCSMQYTWLRHNKSTGISNFIRRSIHFFFSSVNKKMAKPKHTLEYHLERAQHHSKELLNDHHKPCCFFYFSRG